MNEEGDIVELTSQSDEVLMVLYQKGEHTAFDALYLRHSGRVYGYLKRRLREEAEAEDLVQQTFLKLHQYRDRYDLKFPFLPWLFSIVRNLQIDFFRKHRAIPVEIEKLDLIEGPARVIGCDEVDSQATLAVSMSGLTEAQRELIMLRFKQGLSFDEISERIGISSPTARKRISRLIGKIRKVMLSKKSGKGSVS